MIYVEGPNEPGKYTTSVVDYHFWNQRTSYFPFFEFPNQKLQKSPMCGCSAVIVNQYIVVSRQSLRDGEDPCGHSRLSKIFYTPCPRSAGQYL